MAPREAPKTGHASAKVAGTAVTSHSTTPNSWEAQWRRMQQRAVTVPPAAPLKNSVSSLRKAREALKDGESMAHWRESFEDRRLARRSAGSREERGNGSARSRLAALTARVTARCSA